MLAVGGELVKMQDCVDYAQLTCHEKTGAQSGAVLPLHASVAPRAAWPSLPYSTPSAFNLATSSAPRPSQVFSTAAVCSSSSGEGRSRGGLPSTRTGHAGILNGPDAC